jgi:hypothetical protein
MKPPLPPTEILRRVIRVARFDGMGVLALSGGFALVSASWRDVSGSVFGLLIAAAGAVELNGAALLRSGRGNGMRWLISSQLYLLVTILAYVSIGFAKPNVDWMLPYMTGDAALPIQQAAKQYGLTVRQILVDSMREMFALVAILTLIYQGGMTIYYLRRRKAVELAILETEVL